MPWQSEAMKDVVACDKLRESQTDFDPETTMKPPFTGILHEYIGVRGEPGELKHLVPERRNQLNSHSSGERPGINLKNLV